MPLAEETITETNNLAIRAANLPDLVVLPVSKRKESKFGLDWAWYIGNDRTLGAGTGQAPRAPPGRGCQRHPQQSVAAVRRAARTSLWRKRPSRGKPALADSLGQVVFRKPLEAALVWR